MTQSSSSEAAAPAIVQRGSFELTIRRFAADKAGMLALGFIVLLVAFALGLTLFVITLGLNVYALYIVRKYREQYE